MEMGVNSIVYCLPHNLAERRTAIDEIIFISGSRENLTFLTGMTALSVRLLDRVWHPVEVVAISPFD